MSNDSVRQLAAVDIDRIRVHAGDCFLARVDEGHAG